VAGLFRIRVGHHGDKPLDLAPAAKMDEVTFSPADIRARCRCCCRIVAQFREQARGVERRGTVGNEGRLDQWGRLLLVDHALSQSGFGLAHRNGEAFLDHKNCAAMSADMQDKRNPVSGGFAIGLGALLGGLWGVHSGQAILGLAGGIAIGAAIAVLVWLVDRRRG